LALAALVSVFGQGHALAVAPVTAPGMQPDYYETPNWANSPPLAKFVDPLPVLWDPRAGGTAPAKCLPLAVPDTLTYPGSDYYEIEIHEYSEKMHSGLLNNTTLRGYVQVNKGTNVAGTANDVVPAPIRYLGPVIVATKDRPVRIKFTNKLPLIGAGGELFLPVDTTVMGSGPFEINFDPVTKQPYPAGTPPMMGDFSQNRAVLHLHGGRTPWISDGTPHQWITPAGEVTDYPKGVSVVNVPDMWFDASGNTITACAGQTTCATVGATNDPGVGSQTYYYTNQQSARLMFYHDHSWGITRLNVYAGEAAGYIITDDIDKALTNGGTVGGRTFVAGTVPPAADTIPLVIQDKTFVDGDPASPTYVRTTDPTWNWGTGTPVGGIRPPVTSDLWWPHVYMPAENPFNPDMSGMNPFGRWFYGPWFYPPTPVCGSDPNAVPPLCVTYGTVPNAYYDPACVPDPTGVLNNNFCQPPEAPGTPNTSWGAEAFLDTMVVNGAAYPTLSVQPKPYRFRILNAAHDRFLNLQLYQAVNKTGPTTPGAGTPVLTGPATDLTEVAMVPAAVRQPCNATVTTNCTCDPANVTSGSPVGCFPDYWGADGREGGVPDPATRGPAWIQIASEGGFLPDPVLLTNKPVTWNYDPTMFNFGNVNGGTLFVGPAERADVIVDFSKFAGKTLIVYNDAPTAFPALVPQYNYYTGAPDRRDIGGANTILPGVGPNIRTVMQITVAAGPDSSAPVDDYNPAILTALQDAFKPAAGVPGAFELGQEPIIVGQTAYNTTYGKTFPATWPNWGISRIYDTKLSFQKPDGTLVSNFAMKPKAIHDEMGAAFDDYGRMAAKLGLEVPYVNAANQNFVLQNYVDPASEIVTPGGIQIWKITHNGVDTHPIHFHLFDVQVINRVGWDGFIRLPDPSELGWKDTVRISPLEDTIVALRAIPPRVPFALPNSVRPLNPAAPLGSMMGFSQIDTLTGGPLATPTTNQMTNFGNEYVWHCHILSHEENDMMRPMTLRTPIIEDFYNDGKVDITAFNPATRAWRILDSKTGTVSTRTWGYGSGGNTPLAGDFDGDGKSDLAVWRPSTGAWGIIKSSTGTQELPTILLGLGANGDLPVQADYDGDAKTDKAIFNPTTRLWTIRSTSTGTQTTRTWGYATGGNTPVPADYDSDGKTDIAVWRQSTGAWGIIKSSTGLQETPAVLLGTIATGDIPVPGDYDADGKADKAIYKTDGSWRIIYSNNNPTNTVTTVAAIVAPVAGDVPAPGKYCDASVRPAVWRPSTTPPQLIMLDCTTNLPVTVPVSGTSSTDVFVK